MSTPSFRNRREAGDLLAQKIQALQLSNPLVFAVPKGGIPVAQVVADTLQIPLDVAPGIETLSLEASEFSGVTADHRPTHSWPSDLEDYEILIVDDLIANGAAAIAAIRAFQKAGAKHFLIAAGIVSTEALARLTAIEGVQVCGAQIVQGTPSVADYFDADDIIPTDEEVRTISHQARKQESFGAAETEWIDIQMDEGVQVARWRAPQKIRGVVVVVNTEGDYQDASSAIEATVERLDADGIATLCLTMTEYTDDLASLSKRIRKVSNWLAEFKPASGCPLAYFGIGFGGAAMIESAAATPERVKALVCYEAPLQHIADFLPRVHAPTLVVVKDENSENMAGSRHAIEEILVEKSLQILANTSVGIGTVVENWINRFIAPADAATKNARAVPRPASDTTTSALQ